MQETVELFDRFGVSLGMLILFVLTTIYILRRLLNSKDGILPEYVKAAIEHQAKLAESITSLTSSYGKSVDTLEQLAETTSALTTSHIERTDSLFKTMLHSCTVLEILSSKLDVKEQVLPHLQNIRMEVSQHFFEDRK